ncbi:cysteine desulfurase family protein [Ectobacillus antri]|jgi:cysteine desulfurase|uniref:Cysteine desulfurase family protein n=1 Tax=Ectobacillus antri TaxID=2486280 RepID=A0ABT6H535_9BACI|nr:cysteine desulfurase family protein [Ectobacillus antri]MDG4656501.1 cysteine desulfurase family protein [Ectobacillus antri]MDG5753551.1 cysteine desulfurase family protein [Ectobacillus antri]
MIYFDNSATTKPHPEVLQSYVTAAEKYFGNPSSINGLGAAAERLLSQSRSMTAKLLGVKPNEIVFTSGGTEGNNLAIKGTAIRHRSRGRHVITTAIEHASVKGAFNQLEALGFEVTYLPVNPAGSVDVRVLAESIRSDTILVSVMHVNNETGAIQPIEEIGRLLQNHPKVIFHVDNVQGVGKVPLHLKRANIDLCTMSGHKFHGVKGTGILYVREGVTIDSILSGGQQEQYYRSGTENVPGIVAMTKALRMSIEKQDAHIKQLEQIKAFALDELQAMPSAVINTPVHAAPHIINVSFPGLKPEVLVHALEEHDIYISTKSACSSKAKDISYVLLAMGVAEKTAQSAVRISLSGQNTMEEMQQFITVLRRTVAKLYEVMRETV